MLFSMCVTLSLDLVGNHREDRYKRHTEYDRADHDVDDFTRRADIRLNRSAAVVKSAEQQARQNTSYGVVVRNQGNGDAIHILP